MQTWVLFYYHSHRNLLNMFIGARNVQQKLQGKNEKQVLCPMDTSASLTIFKIIKHNFILGTRFRTKQESEELTAEPNADTPCYVNNKVKSCCGQKTLISTLFYNLIQCYHEINVALYTKEGVIIHATQDYLLPCLLVSK